MAATTANQEKYFANWKAYAAPLQLEPHLQGGDAVLTQPALSVFAARMRSGAFGRGRQVRAGTTSGALTTVGTKAVLAGWKPLSSDKFLARLNQMLDGWDEKDPPTKKKLPVDVDVPNLLVDLGRGERATALVRAVVCLTLTAFYFLLRSGEYTCRGGGPRCRGEASNPAVSSEARSFLRNGPDHRESAPAVTVDKRHQAPSGDESHPQTGESEKRVEERVRPPGGKWPRVRVPRQGTGSGDD